ncbi:AAA family ATPase [Vibrio sp. SS-MA-C1-2]|uniref:Lon protease family protein n=1 Tax=Vibrio sp. SS-MA-C1-2 TaxID=2908646 RepID=UPI001F462827|nr:ATP-binding protein [Vibrio sp. SS-MA-C1-2]UJF17270.1 AAA family ATPase [Vibrio sp. SS-MA-C1-2]
MTIQKLLTSDLYRKASIDSQTHKSTKYLEPLNEIVGQARAQQAVEFAMSIPDKGYNIYAIGQNGLGKRTMVLRYLERHHSTQQALVDWCYVANYDDLRTPKVLQLAAGTANQFKNEIETLMTKLVKALPLSFDNEVYYARSEILKNQLHDKQEKALVELTEESARLNISLSMTAQGDYQFIAMVDKETPHTDDSFNDLPKSEQKEFIATIDKLEIKLRKMVRNITEWEEKFSEDVENLNSDITTEVLNHHLKPLIKKYHSDRAVSNYLKEMLDDIIKNVDIFLQDSEDEVALSYAALEKKLPRRYQINVLVCQQQDHYPIVVEENPTYHSLFGYIENATYKGTVFTDYSLIRSGSLHRANGGVLLIDAIKVLERPYVWDGLKRALRSRQLNLTSLEREVTLSGTISLEPESIPLDVKIIIFGDYQTYQLLQHYDPEFKELFKVTADFEDEMHRTKESEDQYARFISSIVHDNKMLHCEYRAISRIIEYSSRQADNQNKLSLHSAHIANLLRESNYSAKSANAKMIHLKHVEQALKNQQQRVSRLQDMVMEGFKNGTTLLQVEGAVVGQVNALSVLATQDFQFGAPNRITATTRFGSGEVVDIERQVNMGGEIHSKGVMILTAYLKSMLAKDTTLPLSTTLTFEQNYGGVDGDSASMAELCAIISAFSEQPIKQSISITGSMNQFGESQPIGGVNEKVEGFFDVCQLKGRDKQQGVIIPSSNIKNLMLRADIQQAIENNEFTIWSVDHVTEAIELLLDKPAQQLFEQAKVKLNALKR